MVTEAASRPPHDLPGLDPRFSRVTAVPGSGVDAGLTRDWHYLDNGDELARLGVPIAGTILAVHGNPTWSYYWRELLTQTLQAAEDGAAADDASAAAAPAWRVIAVDQLDMGFSERTGIHRPLAQRVADLTAFTEALSLDGPVISLGHDWGGVVSLGWAVDHAEQLTGVMLLNTAVHHETGKPIPAPLRLARARGMLAASTVRTPAFLETTLALTSEPLDPAVKDAYRAPYRTAARRGGIGGFVADIPVDSSHESFSELDRIATAVAQLDLPALMLWGPRDPIFSDYYLDDLIERLPHANVHRFEGAGHLVAEDVPYADFVLTWLGDNAASLASPGSDSAPASPSPREAIAAASATSDDSSFVPLWHNLDKRADDTATAVIDMSTRGNRGPQQVSWRQLSDRVNRIAAGLTAIGVRKGQRVSLLVPPGPTLTAVVYACLRIGAVIVVADAGLGVKGLTRAVRGSWPDFVIGEAPGLIAARTLGWPGVRISTAQLPKVSAATLGVSYSLRDLITLGANTPLPAEPRSGDDAAILFTSGSTGPAKGVVYRHGQLSALRDVLASHFEVTSDTGLVTGFAPFALLGPALGTRSVTPEMDVSAPRTLTARAVAAAVEASGASMVFLSPAAILNVVATAGDLTSNDRSELERVRSFLSTGAPIGSELLASVGTIMPNATAHSPYGMTECLLVTDITLDGIRAAAGGANTGVCVGKPIGENQLRISALDEHGAATGSPSTEPGVLGEIVVSAPHLKDHYDRLWLTDREAARETTVETDAVGSAAASDATDAPAAPAARWHRTGDVGHLDELGRLWVEGRLPHVIVTSTGPIAPVGAEQDVESVAAVRRAAVVGVGPHQLRQAVAVVETVSPTRRPGLASPELTAAVRESTTLPLVAVLAVPELPTDIRHNSKIDRSRLSVWAERLLAGGKPTAP
ncbi:acyl-CoA synthetase (AMP-forming)/AMP-acid ligase II [Salinibacterium amurskyense]|uniref:Acyl-CoA synthetase (AMP-forming)/AMP-acid ligase II n=1 Tax=Salinibacterium amurskyense TaxID=205941 RepID=A0A2M9DA54_9MICO|nr:alpha/beta fold hydrolase [Salinibacterium amurskyense]PJJ82605.1 acyl-CoA synthetase (AMP-forming)/AMP-acid ligase II [Salinibacterium amurskyense]RLQ82331.1 alpha/beta fold hydrolase [Salinibacterium amurskyense]GHD76348.1 acyl-CoA synthetase [Salinibacterium amurskyense]